MPTPAERFAVKLKLHAHDFGVELTAEHIAKLQDYYTLLLKWNLRVHLVAPCTPEEFATRHVLESLMLLKHLPPNTALADIGSGGGLPSIPCLIVRDDLYANLFEASQKKCVFLKEALRAVQREDRARVNARFETAAAPDIQFVTCRALDKFEELLPSMIEWAPVGTTFLLFAGDAVKAKIKTMLTDTQVERVPQSEKRFLVMGRQ